jgi:hypothetical protein
VDSFCLHEGIAPKKETAPALKKKRPELVDSGRIESREKGCNMGDSSGKRKSSQAQPWFVEQLIAGLDASAQVKLLLFLVRLHTNRRTGRAWASQETLAEEMNLHISRVTEHCATAKRLGFIDVDRVRTGKHPKDQHNEYWLIIERLRDCQRPRRNEPNQNTHTALAPCDSNEHTALTSDDDQPNTPRQRVRSQGASENEHRAKPLGTQGASAREGFDLKQYKKKAVAAVAVEVEVAATAAYEKAVSSPSGSPAAAAAAGSSDKSQPQTKTFFYAASPENQNPQPELKEFRIDRNEIQNLRRHAKERGIDAEALKAYVLKTFPVTCLAHLTFGQYYIAMNYIHRLPRMPLS